MTVKRIAFMQELLAFVGLEGRLHLEWISSAEARKFVEVVTGFTEKIRRMGPSPLGRFTRPAPVDAWRTAAGFETGRQRETRTIA